MTDRNDQTSYINKRNFFFINPIDSSVLSEIFISVIYRCHKLILSALTFNFLEQSKYNMFLLFSYLMQVNKAGD